MTISWKGNALRILMCAALLLAACDTRFSSIEGQIAQAKRYREKGDLNSAALVLKSVLKEDPANGEARYLLGLAFMQNHQPHWAEHYLRAALTVKYHPETVLPLLAQSLFEQGEFEKVLEATRSSDYGEVALQPEILSLRGHSQLSLGKREDAAASFAEALKRKPEYASALLGEVSLASAKGEFRVAEALVDRALASDPKSLNAWLMKGDLQRAAGKRNEALAAYQRALALNPQGLPANLNLASMHLASGQLDQARKHIDTILKTAPGSVLGYYLLGLLEFRSRNFVAADEAVEKVLKALPTHLPALALSGVIAYSVGANEQAERRLAQASERLPTNAFLRKAYGASLLKSGKAREAIKILDPLLKAAPDDPTLLALYAEAKLENNEIAAARKYFELGAAQNPRDARIRSGLGLARLAAGETEKAMADLEVAGELGAGTADAYLVKYLLSARKYDKALEIASRLETRRPKDPVTFNLKGTILFAKGDVAGARKAFERAIELRPGHFAATVNLAQLDVRDSNPAAARGRFEKMLERDPEDVQAMLAISDLAAVTNQLDEAIRWAERAKRARPKMFAPLLALTKLHFVKGDPARAIAAAKEALAVNPDSAEVLNILGHSQLGAGQLVAALDTYAALAARHPKLAEAHYGLSNAQAANGRFTAAERSLEKALGIRPNFPEAMYALSGLRLRAGRIADAGKLIGDAQKRLPSSPLASIIAGDAAMTGKRYEKAVQAYETAFSKEKSPGLLIKLHGALRAGGRGAAADALAAEWLEKNPGDISVRYVVADTAIRGRNFRLAAEQYEYALKKEPENLSLRHNLVMLYEQMNDPRALATAEAAYRIAPERAGTIFDLARLVMKTGDAGRAIKLLEKARTLAPDSQVVRYDLARAYVKSGDRGQARLELEQLLRGKQEFPERAAAVELLRELKN